MNKPRLVFLLILAFLSVSVVFSQELSVESFRILENDLTANTYGTMEYDQNGRPAALIKVVTVDTGFVFDAGMIGIVKVLEDKAGEIWVYVPYGIRRITIAHSEFGLLRDYPLPVTIERARTYEMRLKTVRAERADTDLTPTVNVTFDNPADSSGIYLNGAFMGTGSWSGLVAAATYLLEVRQEGFVKYSTTITIDPANPEQVIPVPELEPAKGQIMANSIPSDAAVYLDGELKGQSPLLIEDLSAGKYNVGFRLRGFRPYSTAISIKSEETYKAEAVMRRMNHNVYAGIGFQVGHISGFTAYAGLYFWNFNVEAGYLKPFNVTERTYWFTSPEDWNGTMTKTVYDFTLKDAFSFSLGYGIPLGKVFCLTPNVGVMQYRLEGECSYLASDTETGFSQDDYNKASTYVLSGTASVRFEYTPVKYVSLTVSPSYGFPLKKGNLASILDDNTDLIRQWCGGFSINAGVKLFF